MTGNESHIKNEGQIKETIVMTPEQMAEVYNSYNTGNFITLMNR